MLCISVCVRERGRERETEKDTSLHVTCPGNARDEAQKTLSLARARASERARRSTEHTHTYTNTHTTCVFEPVSFGISAHSKRVLRQLVLLPLKTLPFGCQQTLQALSLHLAFQPIPHPMHAIQSNVLRVRYARSRTLFHRLACGRQRARAWDTLRRKHLTTPKTITIKGTPMASTRYKLSRIYRTYCTRSLRAHAGSELRERERERPL